MVISTSDSETVTIDSDHGGDESISQDRLLERCENILAETAVPTTREGKRKRGRPKTKGNLASTLPGPALESFSAALEVRPAVESLLQTTLDGLTRELSMMRGAIGGLTEKISDALSKISELERENAALKAAVVAKDNKILELEEKFDDADQGSRMNQVILLGSVVDEKCENLQARMKKLVSEKLRFAPDKAAEINYHRLGNGPHTVLATVRTAEDRKALFVAAVTIKPENFYVGESLTPKRQHLLFELRKLKRAKFIFTAFSYYGRIYIKTSDRGSKILVSSLTAIKQLVDEYNIEAASNNRLIPINLS